MKKKLFKFLITASVVTVFASFASLAASIAIVEDSEEINIDTGEVSINFTTSEDMEDTDQITALVHSSEASSEPAETDVFYIDQNTKGTYNGKLSIKMKEGATPGETYTLRMGGTGVTTPAEYEFEYENSMKTVSVKETENGIAELSTSTESGLSEVTVEKNTKVKLNITPAIGYYISSIKKNDAEEPGSIDAYKGGTYTYTATADAEFTVTFAKITTVTDEIKKETGMTGTDALTLPAVFNGSHTLKDKEGIDKPVNVAIAFGQIDAAEKIPVEWGIYLTYQDTETPVTTMNSKIGPYFKAVDKSETDNQFGVLFSGLKAANYYAQTYVKYSNGDEYFGIKVPFTIEQYDPVNE